MDILKTHEDGSVEVKFSRNELNALAACIWEAHEMGLNNLYERFFPDDPQDSSGMTEDEFNDTCYEVKREWNNFDIQMS